MKTNISLFFLAFVLFACQENKVVERVLPIIGDRDVEYKMVNGEEVADTIYHSVPSFKYLNQDSIWFDSKTIEDKIWVVNFFFTSCPTICPPMMTNMGYAHDITQDLSEHVEFISFSIDPTTDTPSHLRKYIQMRGFTTDNWNFLSGNEKETHLIAKAFFNGAERNEEAEGGFGHTDYVVLVDTQGYVRGIYKGTEKQQMDLLNSDLRKLLEKEYGINVGK